ncbi:V-set and transmembrane domain-containing protein 1 isoform X4 [Sus scrofa]|uniref:V-set and transmembrane domain containing 1 n=1 Tax=Sus scrofa TaxID=9823 RepID=F1RNI6_PIG|nr:V-set and transmembrane domain-containing protein 1 isoform X4 [Sus scrofa]
MVSKILPLLCLGLCLGYEDEKKHEKLPKPQLHALPSSEIKRHSSVTFRCQSEVQNVTFMLGKLQDSGYRREQNTGRQDAEFLLVNLDSEDAGQYFCAYRTTVSQEWSEESDHLQLTVTDDRGGRGPPPAKTDTKAIFVAAFSCLSLLLLFFAIFFIYRCSQDGSAPEESPQRTIHPKQEAAGLCKLERISESNEDPLGVTYAQLNTNALSEAASVPAEDPPEAHDYATLKV